MGFRVWGVLGFRGGELGASLVFVVFVVGFVVWWGGLGLGGLGLRACLGFGCQVLESVFFFW